MEDTPLSLTLSGSDPDGDPLTFAVASGPANGTLSGTGPDRIYTPAADFFGSDAFTFTVSDGRAASVPATVSITVSEVNDPPVAGADSVSAPSGQPLAIDVLSLLANDTAGPANESTQVLTVTAVKALADTHGTVTLVGSTITYTPDDGFAARASLKLASASPAPPTPYLIRCARPAPSPSTSRLQPTTCWQSADGDDREDTPVPITVTGSDPDGNLITFAVAAAPCTARCREPHHR